MNTKSRLYRLAKPLYFDDSAFSADDIVHTDGVQSRRPGGKIHSLHIHDAYHRGADSIDTQGW